MRVVETKSPEFLVMADERDPENGNSSHLYLVSELGREDAENHADIEFQHGPVKEVGINGITNEVLIEIVLDRLAGFQSGKFACLANANAIHCFREGLGHLMGRTADRIARGVEGTNQE